MISTLILFVVSLFVVIVVHELGHFIVAKRAGVVVEEFGLGFPPRLWGVEWRGTIYSLNALPVGAFVRSKSENDPDVEGSLASKDPWRRLAVYAAGPLFNVFLAFLLLTVYFGLPRSGVYSDGVLVFQVQPGSAAEMAGLMPGDVIVEADGESIETWSDLSSVLGGTAAGESALLSVQREGSGTFPLQVTPEFNQELGRPTIGITLGRNVLYDVAPGSPAAAAGMEQGDSLLTINNAAIYSEDSYAKAVASAEAGSMATLTLMHGAESYSVEMAATQLESGIPGAQLRYAPDTRIESRPTPVLSAAAASLTFIVSMPSLIVASLPLVQQDPSLAFVGPIGAGQLTVEAVQAFGLSNLIFLGGLISIGIALFNFFPIPPLDGGGMLVALIEAARRGRRLSQRAIRFAYAAGTALLITLVVFITTSDVLRLVQGRGFGI
jgi:regulator of sigma E protease